MIANAQPSSAPAPVLARVPPDQRADFGQMLKAERASALDQTLAEVMKASPTARWAMTHGMYAFGVSTPRAYVAATLDYNLGGGVTEKMSCPTLLCDAEGDLFFKGQPQLLYDRLTCPKTMIRFTNAEGAGPLAFARIYDWLDETLG